MYTRPAISFPSALRLLPDDLSGILYTATLKATYNGIPLLAAELLSNLSEGAIVKELLALLTSKTQSLTGRKVQLTGHLTSKSQVTQALLNLLSDSFYSVGDDDLKSFVASLDGMRITDRVVLFEGAFSGAVCLDVTRPLEYSRAKQLASLAPQHIARLGLGVGHALANLGVAADITPEVANHYLGWLAMDAYGMHDGYFNWFDRVHEMKTPEGLPPFAAEAFDQGLGRALWFIAGSDWRIIEQLVERFSYNRRFSLWRGIGLMAGFWGAEDEQQLKKLFKAASTFRPFFQQGAAQAVCMRFDMDDVADHNDSAAKLICGGSTSEVADLARTRMEKFAGEVLDSKIYFSWQNELVDFFSETATSKKKTSATKYNTRRFLLDTP